MGLESFEERLCRVEEEIRHMKGRQDFSESKVDELFKWKPLVDSELNEIRNEIEE